MDREKIIEKLEKEVKRTYTIKSAVWEFCENSYKKISEEITEHREPGVKISMEMADEILALLKEQEAVEWINVKDKLPKKDGQYLVVYTFFNYKGMAVVRFSHNLHEVDEYIFGEENRPGWYESDDEVGYFERTTVTHWAKLPEFPKEGR